MSGTVTVAVIGLGSRGLSVLERIVTLAYRAGPAVGPVRVEVIDPRCDGAGIHTTDQPDYLLLNTTCGQVSMFPDAHTVGAAVDRPGPSLYEWATGRGLRLADDGYTVDRSGSGRLGPAGGREIRPTDFLPRRLLGEYLGWFFDLLRQRAGRQVPVRTHRTEAVDLGPDPAGDQRIRVTLADGTSLAVDYLFLTTGYTANQPAGSGPAGSGPAGSGPAGSGPAGSGPAGAARLVPAPYPLPQQVEPIQPGESVAIGGFGLSAMDLMSCLTVGRGGRFRHTGAGCQYLPSGREPRLLFYSRSGLPGRARPQVMRVDSAYRPLVFTLAAVDQLRAARGGGLDFEREVLPLVQAELRIAYRRRQAGLAGPAQARELERSLADAGGPDAIAKLLDELDGRLDRFDPAAAFEGSAGMALDHPPGYQAWLAGVLRDDLAEGVRGFTGSPLKSALDVLRALRDTFRYVVDFGGLTDDSLVDFHRQTVPMLNRAVVGPQFERHRELLALLAAGTAAAPFGPAPELSWQDRAGRWTIRSTRLGRECRQEVDWVAAANVVPPAVAGSASRLIRALHQRGWIRPHRPASAVLPGIDLAADQHPVRADGQPERRIWVLGPLCEGATYYTNLVPSPGAYSRPVFDAHRCVAAMFAAAAGRPVSPALVARPRPPDGP
jgi:uncharacterized NAD(P)/FAD-binding protein YdhS